MVDHIEGKLTPGKRYRIRSRPFDMSYIDAVPDDQGDWIYNPVTQPQDSEDHPDECSCYECRAHYLPSFDHGSSVGESV